MINVGAVGLGKIRLSHCALMRSGVRVDVGIENPIVRSNIHKIGFRMCGCIEAYERAMRDHQFLASVYASGRAARAREAIESVCRLPNLRAIVFGASCSRDIAATRELVDQYWRP